MFSQSSGFDQNPPIPSGYYNPGGNLDPNSYSRVGASQYQPDSSYYRGGETSSLYNQEARVEQFQKTKMNRAERMALIEDDIRKGKERFDPRGVPGSYFYASFSGMITSGNVYFISKETQEIPV